MLFDVERKRINERNEKRLRDLPKPNSYKKGGACVYEVLFDGPYYSHQTHEKGFYHYPRAWRIQKKHIKARNMREGQIGDLVLKTKIHSTNNGCVPVSIGLAPPFGTCTDPVATLC